jgi:glycosyltransferase involved in cell wall biosynthesis
MRKISLGTTYYNCPELLSLFVSRNLPFVDELLIVDDGSIDRYSIDKHLKPSGKLKLLRVRDDIGFNSHGCRNLIMQQSSNDWVVLIDIDREFKDPQYTFESLKSQNLYTNIRYLFMVHTGNWGSNVHPAVNDYLINKELFFSAGGYDEEIAGQRWGDREFFKQLLTAGGKESLLYNIDLIHTRKSSVLLNDNLARSILDKPYASHQNLIQQRIQQPDPNKPIVQFEWYQLS